MKSIKFENFNIDIFNLWKNQWFLLTSGNFKKNDFNTMTVAWGSFGIMWNKPFAQIVVRPTRFTYNFTEKFNSFTLSAFSDNYKSILSMLGTKSGRDTDKITESGLTPIASEIIESPAFEEAELILECKKIYWDDFKSKNFLDNTINTSYPQKDYHRIYFGEILKIKGTDKYSK